MYLIDRTASASASAPQSRSAFPARICRRMMGKVSLARITSGSIASAPDTSRAKNAVQSWTTRDPSFSVGRIAGRSIR
jgi:hypothetical protein